jgi:hypothetical protein
MLSHILEIRREGGPFKPSFGLSGAVAVVLAAPSIPASQKLSNTLIFFG